jgi:protein-L-isoaspartate(D-aspartate) O-methyltransferase
VAMQGAGSSPTRRIALRGDDIVLSVDDTTTEADRDALIAALAGPRVEEWAPVTISPNDGSAYESLHLWLASTPRPFGVLTVDRERTRGLVDPQDRFVCPTLLTGDSFAYLALGQTDNTRWQFGAHGFGPHATELTAALIEDVVAWDRDHRHHAGPTITVHPAGSEPPTSTGRQALVRRRHTSIAVTWPGEPGNR